MVITSSQNPFIKYVRGLKDKKHRDAGGCFVVEGEKELSLAVQARVEFEAVIYAVDKAGEVPDVVGRLRERLAGQDIRWEAVSLDVFAKCAYRERPGGVLGVAKIPRKNPADLVLPENPLVLAAVGLEKPGNLGAILRTADGAGADAVLFCDGCSDLYNPNVVRGSLGALFTVPCFTTNSTDAFGWLAEHQIPTIATTPSAKTLHTEIGLIGPTCIALGSEAEGLPNNWLKKADRQVRIPLLGRMDSLNVSCSAAILLYEARRQRGENH